MSDASLPPLPPLRRAVTPPPPSTPSRGFPWIRLILILAVMMIMGGLGFVALTWLWLGGAVDVQPGTWLEVSFSSSFPDEQVEDPGLFSDAWGQVSAQELLPALWHARDDDRIVGVVLRADGYGGGWAQAEELRSALLAIRAAGKPVTAYVESPSASAYYLATAAESIVMPHEGLLRITGLQIRLTYLKGSLDKLGVQADYVAVGAYKSAPEQLLRAGPSEPGREQFAEYLDDVYEVWIDDLAEGRGLTRERMSMLVDRGLFDVSEALAEGLIDVVADAPSLWVQLTGDEDPPRLSPLPYLSAALRDGGSSSGAVAVVFADGTIVTGVSGRSQVDGKMVGSETLIERLRRAREDKSIRAVVLRVNSPGGSALASDLIVQEIKRLRGVKPLVISVGNMAASGGYYIAAPADRILASSLSITGSIGVYTGKLDVGGLYDKLGVSFEVLQRGANADIFSDLTTFTQEQRLRIRQQLEAFYGRFLDHVANGRSLEVEAVGEVAQGRAWSGARAVELGLVDELGGLSEAVAVASALAGIDDPTPTGFRTFHREPTFFQRVFRQFIDQNVRTTPVGPAARALTWWSQLPRTLDGSPQFHTPWRLSVE